MRCFIYWCWDASHISMYNKLPQRGIQLASCHGSICGSCWTCIFLSPESLQRIHTLQGQNSRRKKAGSLFLLADHNDTDLPSQDDTYTDFSFQDDTYTDFPLPRWHTWGSSSGTTTIFSTWFYHHLYFTYRVVDIRMRNWIEDDGEFFAQQLNAVVGKLGKDR